MALPTVRPTRPLGKWDPFRGFEELFQAVDSAGAVTQNAPWTPLADVSETEHDYVVEVETPGVTRDDITIDIAEQVISIRGERQEPERDSVFRRRARRTGQFSYRLALPRDIDADNVGATLDNGVLTVHVPKSAAAQPRRVEITG